MRILLAALAALLLPVAPAVAAPWAELPFQALGHDRIAACLAAAGPDRVALSGSPDSSTEDVSLARVAPDGALVADGDARLGALTGCARVSAAPSGAALAAAIVAPVDDGDPAELVATTRDPGAAFGRPARIAAPADAFLDELAVAVAPDGAAVLAWTERLLARDGVRLRVARRPAGGAFGASQTLLRQARDVQGTTVGIDGAGRATVAWSRSLRNPRWAIEVATAAPGLAFGPPQRLTPNVDAPYDIALAVAPDGGVLLAHDGGPGIRVFERAPGAPLLRPGPAYPDVPDPTYPNYPVVALADGGAGLVAWLRPGGSEATYEQAVELALRAPGGQFQPSQVLGQTVAGSPAPTVDAPPPSFEPLEQPRSIAGAVGPGGVAVVGWLEAPAIAGADAPARVGAATGTVTGGWEAAGQLGGPTRSADGLAVLARPAAALWTDNLPAASAFGIDDAPAGDGRLHRALPGAAAAPAPAPAVTLSARRQSVRVADPVIVTARCAAACDLRAVAGRDRGFGGPKGFAAAALGGPGEVDLKLRSVRGDDLVPRGGRPLRVSVHATALGGREAAEHRVAVPLRHAFVPPPRRPLDVRVSRQGPRVVVTWRTAKPARAERFVVAANRRRHSQIVDITALRGRGRTRFRAVLEDARGARWIELEWASTEPRLGSGRLALPLSGGRT